MCQTNRLTDRSTLLILLDVDILIFLLLLHILLLLRSYLLLLLLLFNLLILIIVNRRLEDADAVLSNIGENLRNGQRSLRV